MNVFAKCAQKIISIVKNIFVVIMKIINIILMLSIKISDIVLVFTLVLVALLTISVIVLDHYFTNGYFIGLIINSLVEYKAATNYFSLCYAFIENKYPMIILPVCILSALIFLKVIFNKIIRKIIKWKTWKIIMTSIGNIIIWSICFFLVISMAALIIGAEYITNLNKEMGIEKHNTPQFNELMENIETYLDDRKVSANIVLGKLIYEINNGIINVDSMNDEEYIAFGIKLCRIMDMKGSIDVEQEHYLRNYFTRGPDNLSEMIETIQKGNIFGWQLVSPEDATLHMIGKDGEYNLKFVSSDGHFEIVYNKNGEKLTEKNDPINMGTFNYANPLLNKEKHSVLDVVPYVMWGNIAGEISLLSMLENGSDEEEPNNFYENSEAVERYNNIKEQISR